LYPLSLNALRAALPRAARGLTGGVPSTVVYLGITSCLTDISSEMVTSVLPLYLVVHLQLTPLAFGAIDALHQGGASVLRVLSGLIADRSRQYQRVAAVGYAASALSKLGLLLWGKTALALAALTVVDRLGKGLRSSPRDALISLSVPAAQQGRAFGVHRTWDTVGALCGPLFAFGLLRLVPDAYDAVFVVSLCFALVGVAVLLQFVRSPESTVTLGERAHPPDPRAVLRSLRALPGWGALTLAAGGLGLLTISDSFLYLLLQRRVQFETANVPLLYVSTPAVFFLLAFPVGKLADRAGAKTVLLAGHALLLLSYGVLLLPLSAGWCVSLLVLCLGAYYAATDGVLVALASKLLPVELRTSGIAWLSTIHQLARMAAGVGFGWLWSHQDPNRALCLFMAAGAVLLPTLARALRGVERVPANG
jgi:MFS family permease